MKFSKKLEKELIELSQSASLKKDMEIITLQKHNPFIKNGRPDPDAYIEFVTQYNEFINHKQKPFEQMIDKDMKL